MKMERGYITNEDQGKIDWAQNAQTVYAVVNKDSPNEFGEYRGYKIAPATNNAPHTVIQNSSDLGQAINWAYNNLYVVQQHDNEPRSAYPYNNKDPNVPVVDFAKFFNGESIEQEDLVIYFNLGMHHLPVQADLPNTVFTTAASSFVLTPQNYILGDPSRASIHQVRIDFINGSVTDTHLFGQNLPTCELDMTQTHGQVTSWVGEVITSKYPFDPSVQDLGNPGA